MATVAELAPPLKADVDHIECYRTFGRRCDRTGGWKLLLRGRVVQARPDNLRRKLLIKLLCKALNPTQAQLDSPIFRKRLDHFLVLSRPSVRVSMRVGDRTVTLDKRSKHNGLFQQVVPMPQPEPAEVQQNESGRRALKLAPVIRGEGDKDRLSPAFAHAELIPSLGVSVISDIDDTLKLTRVGDRREMLANTFVNEFRSVDGIREAYTHWARQGAVFHYVSSSPWQLYRPLSQFMDEDGFPSGSFHLRMVKLQGPSILHLLTDGKRSKRRAIRSILAWYPGRHFVLVGDAREKDPEIYGAIARRHPVQVAGIFIRGLESANMSRSRFKKAFRHLPPDIWRVFEDPAELSAMYAVDREGYLRWTI